MIFILLLNLICGLFYLYYEFIVLFKFIIIWKLLEDIFFKDYCGIEGDIKMNLIVNYCIFILGMIINLN